MSCQGNNPELKPILKIMPVFTRSSSFKWFIDFLKSQCCNNSSLSLTSAHGWHSCGNKVLLFTSLASKEQARKGTRFIVLFSVSGCYIPMTNDPPAEESVLCSSLLSRSNNKSFKLNYSTDNRLYIFEYLLKVCKAKTQTLIHNFLHICWICCEENLSFNK